MGEQTDMSPLEKRLRADERFRSYVAWIVYPIILFMLFLLVV